MKRIHPRHFLYGFGVATLAATAFAGEIISQHGTGFAATTYNHNPVGYADYCALENGNTVIYGWAHDPDAPAGAYPKISVTVGTTTTTIPTDRAGYRDAAVNSYLQSHYPGAPTSSIYGWRLQLGGLYKGTSYKLSGTILNYGSGSNFDMYVHQSNGLDGDASKLGFPGSAVPDGCLADKPAPAPSPTPTPTPTPRKTTKPAPATPAAPTLSSDANATVTAGSYAATLTVPNGNAAKVHLTYGIDLVNNPTTSQDQNTTGDNTTITLDGLQPHMTYTYQIVRSDASGHTTTSAAATFMTHGVDATLHFTNNAKIDIAGIKATLKPLNMTATSDKQGNLTFPDLSAGDYTVNFSYAGENYTSKFSAPAAAAPRTDAMAPAVVTKNLNLDQLRTVAATKAAPKTNPLVFILPLMMLLAGAAAVSVIIIKKRRAVPAFDTAPLPKPQAPMPAYKPTVTPPTAIAPTVVTPAPVHHAPQHHDPASQPIPEHAGVSLKDMVLEGMAEQAKQQKPISDIKPPAHRS